MYFPGIITLSAYGLVSIYFSLLFADRIYVNI